MNATLRLDFPPRGDARIAAGKQLREPAEIDSFLAQVDSFYEIQQSQSNNKCVFDFTLAWRTDGDYRAARELVERYFYPARLRQLR